MTFATAKHDPRFIELSENNRKLQPTATVKYLIWNIPAIITCPYATEHCKEKCYAVKSEKAYPGCLPCRERHLKISRDPDFIERMVYTINCYMSKPAYKNAKHVIFRIHESGDFYNQSYTDSWIEIMNRCRKYKNLVFVAYTKSVVFFLNREKPKNLNLLLSVWDDTSVEQLEHMHTLINRWNCTIYTADYEPAVNEIVKKAGNVKCLCDNCSHCMRCFLKNGGTTWVIIH